ncbi:MAG TPA: hypothetical protein VMF89_15460 [Polyangiales bacterium]|nr:hypothetical protein [Polyangiales bacterium]
MTRRRIQRALRAGALIALLAACSDVQSVQLGEVASAGARSAAQDAAASPPTLDKNRDAGTADAPRDRAQMDGGPARTPDPSQPSAADSGADRPDARIDRDVDDDDDEDSEESPEPREDEDAGEPRDD